jgi:glycosyltransferase involved in cell wall biosynthesis
MSFISTIIPTLNRPVGLVSAVTSILKQKHQPDELIIVDQSLDELSYKAVKDIYSTFDVAPKLVYLHEPKVRGLIEAKQRGVEVAKGDIISFLEDDVVLHPRYFENVASIFASDQKILGCCGVMSNQKSGLIYEYLFRLFHRGIFYDARLNAGKIRDCNGNGVLIASRFLSGGISCYRKKVFESVKFDTLNDFFMLEDIDFSTRAADFFGNEYFFISTCLCLEHNMSPINRLKLYARWLRKLRENVLFYKKHRLKLFSFINFLWLLIGLLGESIVMSILSRSFGPLFGFLSGLIAGIRQKVVK